MRMVKSSGFINLNFNFFFGIHSVYKISWESKCHDVHFFLIKIVLTNLVIFRENHFCDSLYKISTGAGRMRMFSCLSLRGLAGRFIFAKDINIR